MEEETSNSNGSNSNSLNNASPEPSAQNKQQTEIKDSNFLSDLTDGRKPGDWKSRYELEAHKLINKEKRYLILVFVFSLFIPLCLGIFHNESQLKHPYIHLKQYIFSFTGGTLGGTLYSAKWLVHSVAKNNWNADRRLWRLFTPFVSGSLALCIGLLTDSGMMNVTNSDTVPFVKSYGVGFLVGYFSDNAVGKLTEIAKVFFGSPQTKK